MFKAIFDGIKARLETIDELKTVGIYNNQFVASDQHSAYLMPAAWMAIDNDGVFEYNASGVQQAEIDIALYIQVRELHLSGADPVGILDMLELVHNKMQNFILPFSTSLERVGVRQDLEFTNYATWVLVYRATFTDDSTEQGDYDNEITGGVEIGVDIALETELDGVGDATPAEITFNVKS